LAHPAAKYELDRAVLDEGSEISIRFKVIVLSSGAIGPKSNTHRCFPTVGSMFVGIDALR